MKNVVIINSGHQDVIRQYNVAAISTQRELNVFYSLLRSVLVRINPKNISKFTRKNWLDDLKSSDIIIVFDCMGMIDICRMIADEYPNNRLILFYWNPIKDDTYKLIPKEFEKWTSDYGDAQKYGFKYNGQFVYEKYFTQLNTKQIKYDFYFVGLNKGRFDSLRKIETMLKKKSMKPLFRYVSPVKSIFNKKYDRPIPYKNVLEETAQTKAVVEYNQKGQQGFTLRCIESLALQKKLLTNNTEIVKYHFYKPSNIFLINNDTIEGIELFMHEDFRPYAQDIVSQYYFSNWLDRIVSNIEFEDRKE